MAKRPIDRLRDGAGAIDVGTKEEGPMVQSVTIGDALYGVKMKAIYRISLADEIDPGRTNIDIPNVAQKVASEGAESERVGRIFLTGAELFNDKFLEDHISRERALTYSLNILHDVIAMHEIGKALRVAQNEAEKPMKPGNAGFTLGAITDTRARATSFLQKAEHATQTLYGLCTHVCKISDKDKKRLFDGIAELVEKKYGAADDFTAFAKDAAEVCRFIRTARNCVEHPKPSERVVFKDYSMLPSGAVRRPTIEVVHPKMALEEKLLDEFMEDTSSRLLQIVEGFMVSLCSKNMKARDAFPIHIKEIPEERRRSKNVRFEYVVEMHGGFSRIS